MPEYPDKLKSLVERLRSLEDRNDRIQILNDIADGLGPVPESIATKPYPEERRIPGCESQVYVWPEDLPDGTIRFYFAVENPHGISAKALVAVFENTLSGEPLDRVAAVPLDIVHSIFGNELSMGKAMALTGIVQYVSRIAKDRAGL